MARIVIILILATRSRLVLVWTGRVLGFRRSCIPSLCTTPGALGRYSPSFTKPGYYCLTKAGLEALQVKDILTCPHT